MASQQPKLFTHEDLPILLPDFHRWMAREHPDFVVRKDVQLTQDQIKTARYDHSQWRDVTCAKFAELVDAAAFLLGEDDFAGWPLRTDKDPKDAEPPKIAALLGSETASVVTLEGLIKRGLSTLTLSPRNTIDLLITMLVDQNIEHLIYAPPFAQLAAGIKATLAQQHPSRSLALGQLPSFERLSDYDVKTPFPYDLDTRVEWTKPVLYVHTSGSSGNMPTICAYTHEMLIKLPLAYQWDSLIGARLYCAVPIFHVMAHFFGIVYSGTSLQTRLTPPGGPPLAGSDLAAFLKGAKATSALLVPAQIDSLMDVPEGLEVLSSLDAVFFGGASLRRSTKEKLDGAKVNYLSGYGSSEVSACGLSNYNVRPSGLDGEWLQPLDTVKLSFELYNEASGDMPALYSIFARNGTIPCSVSDSNGVCDIGDLVERHPDYPEWFKIFGRRSSFVVLANGENAPVPPIEDAVSSHESVEIALLFGKGQTQVGLLVELKAGHTVQPGDHAAAEAARNEIWPTIEKVNKTLPDFAQLFKNMIIFTTPDRPVPRADKGSPKRQVALNIYDTDIEALYASVTAGKDSAIHLGSIEVPALLDLVKSILVAIYGEETPINPDTSLTLDLGQDSLRATMTRTSIVSSLRAAVKAGTIPQLSAFSPDVLPANLTYQCSTPADLANFLHNTIIGNGKSAGDVNASQTAMMKQLIEKYSQQLIASKPGQSAQPGLLNRIFGRSSLETPAHVVLLTGSTGAFGTTILELLVQSPHVKKVICLIRSTNPDRSALLARQAQSFSSRDLDTAPAHSSKVDYLHGNPTDPKLIVPEEVTSIIHAAWSVNFNLTLADFIPEIEGTVRLLQHCQKTGARLVFASSVSTIMGAPEDAGKETSTPGLRLVDEDEDSPLEWASLGYGRSKTVIEKLISKAVHEGGVKATSIRCGQIIGDARTGAWNEAEWAPTVFRSAEALGALPDDLGIVDWITVNDAMKVLVAAAVEPDVKSITTASSTNIVNLVNPRRVPWNQIVEAFRAHLPAGIKVLSNQEWLARLEEATRELSNSDDQKAYMARVPAVNLIGTYQGMVSSMNQTLLEVKAAKTLTKGEIDSAVVVDGDLAGRFVNFWQKSA
ncbi:hypothetical protein A4X13_0g1140 [Tilletia indica]|uniref:Carrier domain-containing protein n=1 Tax=Tilletia indica TaxID=43049 RepID=A0A177TBL8_9BASI|nr:hypothetical protein A4X13_0g1140 [Tilletia indica]